VLNATSLEKSVISWLPVLLVEEAGEHVKNNQSTQSQYHVNMLKLVM